MGGIGDTTGVITKGQFRGLRVRYIGPSIPFPDICASQKAGVTKGFYVGVGMFGDYVLGSASSRFFHSDLRLSGLLAGTGLPGA